MRKAVHVAGTWFPIWLLVAMTVLYAGVVAVHAAHLASQRGTARLWSGAHLLMAVGMLVMVLPLDRMLLGGTAVVLVYVAAALGCLVVGLRTRRGPGGSQLWFVAVVDLAAMAYMFAPGSVRSLAVGVILTVALAVEAAYWASGYFAEVADRDGLACVPAAAVQDVPPAGSGGSAPMATAPVEARTGTLVASSAGFLTRPWVLRASMVLMALGMAYMLAAMSLPAAASSGGGGHVHGMAGR